MGSKVTIEELREIARKNGGVLLSKNIKNLYERLDWKCKEGHTWNTVARIVRDNKSWCPYCAGQIKGSVKDMQAIAKKRGGKFLSKKYFDTNTKYEWQCANGHKWKAEARSVKRGSWCGKCNINFGEEICRLTFETIFNTEFIKSNPKWLKNNKGFNLQLDGYSAEKKIAFEYNGSQHYSKTHFFNIKRNNTPKNDKEKINLCKKNGVKLFIISYKDKLDNLKGLIKLKCNDLNINIKNLNFSKKINYNRIYSHSSPLKKLETIAKKKGGKCLSKKYLGIQFPLKFQCREGHTWKTKPEYVIAGNWCHQCGNYKTINLKKLKSFARNKGGKILSKKYLGTQRKHQWKCKNEHIFYSRPANVIHQGNWCPICKGLKKLTIEIMRDVAKKKGGRCLSERYINVQTKLKWKCSKGHIWMATPANVKNKSHWCGICAGNRGRGLQKFLNS